MSIAPRRTGFNDISKWRGSRRSLHGRGEARKKGCQLLAESKRAFISTILLNYGVSAFKKSAKILAHQPQTFEDNPRSGRAPGPGLWVLSLLFVGREALERIPTRSVHLHPQSFPSLVAGLYAHPIM